MQVRQLLMRPLVMGLVRAPQVKQLVMGLSVCACDAPLVKFAGRIDVPLFAHWAASKSLFCSCERDEVREPAHQASPPEIAKYLTIAALGDPLQRIWRAVPD